MTDQCEACGATDPEDRRPRPERYGGGRCFNPFHGAMEQEEVAEAHARMLVWRQKEAERLAELYRPKTLRERLSRFLVRLAKRVAK